MPGRTAVILFAVVGVLAAAAFFWGRPGPGAGARNPIAHEISAARLEPTSRSGKIGADEMRAILQRPAQGMIEALNELGVMDLDSSAVHLLSIAWLDQRAAEPSLNWSAMGHLHVRFALANELVRARVNGTTNIPIHEVVAFGREHLTDANDAVMTNRAIFIVVLAGDDTDIARVERLLNETKSNAVFEAGMSALLSTCRPTAATAVEGLKAREQDPFRKSLIVQAIERSAAFRARRCDKAADRDSTDSR